MISSRKIQFTIILILAGIVLPVIASEPNEPNKPETELKFEISNQPGGTWRIEDLSGIGPIAPEYVVLFYIKTSNNIPRASASGQLNLLLETKTGKLMSARQKEFLETSSCYERSSLSFPQIPIDYIRIRLYAVSQDDAKKMAQAFIEIINDKAIENISQYEWEIKDREQKLSDAKRELPEKESEYEKIKQEYEKLKDQIHSLSSDTEAVDLAKKSIIEMDKTLNGLEIELAGINQRLKTIIEYKNDHESMRPEVAGKLDVMYVELVVELSGLEAKKEMTEKINSMEQNFVSLFYKRAELHEEIRSFSDIIEDYPERIERLKDQLKTHPNMQPAEVYQNTVTIYPVVNYSLGSGR